MMKSKLLPKMLNVAALAAATILTLLSSCIEPGLGSSALDHAQLKLTVDRYPAVGGTVTPTTRSDITAGTTVNITATPASGYTFRNWTVTSGNATFANANSAATTVTMNWNATITANFQLIPTYTLTVDRDPAAGGTVTPTSQSGIAAGTKVNITATPASGYRFVYWTVTKGTATFANAYSAATTVTLGSSNTTIRANFEQIQAQTYTLTVNRDPAAGGTVTPASPQSGIAAGTPVNISASANSGYTFTGWAVTSGTATFANADSATTTVTLSSNATIRANFVQIQAQTYTLTVNRDPVAGGTVTPTTRADITAGTPVNISASANSGYTFTGWVVTSGTAAFGNAGNASTMVTLSSNATIVANFQQTGTIDGGTFADVRDGNEYRTVIIGGKRWMAENLNYNASGSVCYGNQAGNCTKYGRLYTWSQVMGGASSSSSNPSGVRGICPAGWHVPSDAEWTALTDAVGGASTAGTKLKSRDGWNSGGNGTDNYGFSALPGGYGHGGVFVVGSGGRWWSATEYDAGLAWGRHMFYDFELVNRYNNDKTGQFSLRCLQDD